MKGCLAGTLALALGSAAHACPVCDTETGAAVRAGIFNDAFPVTLIEVLAPFPVLALVVYLVNRSLPN